MANSAPSLPDRRLEPTTGTSPSPRSAAAPTRNFVTVVSGLPRTGTSMMMRILEAGGVEPMTDALRTADIDNPNGYYEFEPVKRTKEDPSWIDSAYNKSVKLVYLLLYDLPATHRYRIIFMQRDLGEVIVSQNKMLVRHGKLDQKVDDALIMKLFRAHLEKIEEWLPRQKHFEVLYVNYHDMLTQPREQAERISQFLGGGLDVESMAAVVDPALYRNRR